MRKLKRALNRPENRLSLRILQAIDVCYARIFHHLQLRSRCAMPDVGPAILVCNHMSHLDPFLIQSACPRLVSWMMTHEFYDLPYLRWFFRTVDAIRVERRSRDLSALRGALRKLEEGRVVGIFPEGGIEPTRELMPFQTGVALLAIKSGAPVYPAYIDGTHRGARYVEAFLTRQQIALSFGPPLHFQGLSTEKEDLESATAQIRDAVRRLQEEQRQRRPLNQGPPQNASALRAMK